MHKLTVSEAELAPSNGIHIGRWSQYAGLGALPFDAMWFEVPAHGQSKTDCHPEVELAVVVDGEATFTVDGRDTPAPRGTAILLQPGESHVVHANDGPVRVLSIYWLPEEKADA
ncbi:MAG TPA: cupin domain-containing protein [Amycolatopsis sp.]|nr:cupin domain-containing protein [Amycolatopsis sp.]